METAATPDGQDTPRPGVAAAGAQAPPGADFTPAQLERSRARKRDTAALRYGSLLTGAAVPCVLGFTPLGAGLSRAAGALAGGGWTATAALGAVAVQLVLTLAALPFSLRGEVVNRRWGLSTRSWGLYAADAAKGLLLGAVLLAAVSVGLFALVRALPQSWWLVAAPVAAALVVLMSFLLPVVFEPLFNRFEPMPEGELRSRLLELAGRSGVRVRDILVADASRRTTAANAYVSGIGRTRRVVVWDTTVRQAAPEEVAAIAAHELGHAARRDVATGTAAGAVGGALAVLLIAAALHWGPLLRAAGVTGAADPRALALVLALGTVLGTIAGPFGNAFSRRIEARADGYALELTRAPGAMVAMQRRLAVLNIADLSPHPLTVLLFATHPPTAARIAHARAWAREHGTAA
ncbi:M48 family metallopeptidase [Streptacidiphilus sp. PB12-B1b]|uniref:M48 family metallopeptidase n=1 Tax=Streptacidiphilus sp. PB12-B1b TaxID=2705012 RepID=UPI0015FC3FFE|nr:M48 family metallopeptidase [Streptacidiphilus sp. PB12-B1b]QMU77682.1 M48 family metallopeptidase [Streptacidiphilus sp. PB12-B1b]